MTILRLQMNLGPRTGGRRQAERRRRLAEVTAQLRLAQQEREDRAVLDERVRIARELHDVVGYHMSVVSLQAGLAKLRFQSDPAVAEQALAAVAEASSRALEETRRLVTVLRPDTDAAISADHADSPSTGVDQFSVLIERTNMAGLPVDFTVEGAPRPVPPSIGLCAYRIVQESLTNVIKHASSAPCSIRLRYRPTSLTVVVTNQTPVRANDLGRRPADGHGLAGMRERAAHHGGSVSAGQLPDGGFQVRLTLPLLAHSDQMTAPELVH